MLHIEPLFYPFAALLLLLLPLPWLFAALFAAVIHELFHVSAILLLGGKINGIHIGFGKTVIDGTIPGLPSELLCALAGPFGSFLLLFLYHWFPRLAFCGAVQGLFNMIPLLPLDGGRVLRCILLCFFPENGDCLFCCGERIILILLVFFCSAACVCLQLGPIPIVMLLLFLWKRKKPCKQAQIGIQ